MIEGLDVLKLITKNLWIAPAGVHLSIPKEYICNGTEIFQSIFCSTGRNEMFLNQRRNVSAAALTKRYQV